MKNLLPSFIRELFEDAPAKKQREMASVWSLFKGNGAARADAFDAERTWDALAEDLDLDGKADAADADSEGIAKSGRARSGRLPVNGQAGPERPGPSEPAAEKREDRQHEPRQHEPRQRGDDRRPAARRPVARRLVGWRSGALTAAILLVAVGAWLLMRPVRVTTAPGEQATITLPDGSSVELNGATALAYPRGFGALPFVGPEARRVRLTGEAFFSVRSASRPFVVKTPDARVEVLGTQFTVETRAVEKGERAPEAGASKAGASKAGATGAGDGSLTRVALRSGRVRFSAAGGSEGAVTLSKPGHVSHLTSARATPTPPETTDLTYLEAWRHGGFAVREASLPETLRKLERRFGASLRLDADSMAARPLTLLYARNASLEQVLKDICLVQGLTFRASSQGYVLTRP